MKIEADLQPTLFLLCLQVLALTFDDGPQAKGLNAVLDVLKRHAVPATFFVNTYRDSDWLGPFNSQANQVSTHAMLVTVMHT